MWGENRSPLHHLRSRMSSPGRESSPDESGRRLSWTPLHFPVGFMSRPSSAVLSIDTLRAAGGGRFLAPPFPLPPSFSVCEDSRLAPWLMIPPTRLGCRDGHQ